MPAIQTDGRNKVQLSAITFSLFTTRPTSNSGTGTDYTGYVATFQDFSFSDQSKNAEYDPAAGLPVRRLPTNPDWSITFKGVCGGDSAELVKAITDAKAGNLGRVWIRATWVVGSTTNIATGLYQDSKITIGDINSQDLTIQCDGVLPSIG